MFVDKNRTILHNLLCMNRNRAKNYIKFFPQINHHDYTLKVFFCSYNERSNMKWVPIYKTTVNTLLGTDHHQLIMSPIS